MENENSIPFAKKRILEASFTAFNTKGFQAVSMDAVSKDLKISKKTIYKYFASKEELLEAALVNLFGQVETKLALLERQKSQRDVLQAYFQILKYWRLALMSKLREELGNDLPHLHERVETFERQILLRHLIGILKDLRAAEMIDYPSPSREFAVTFFTLMGSLVQANEEQAYFFLSSLAKGMTIKKKKKK